MIPGATITANRERGTVEIPEIGFCEKKHRLLTEFVSAVKELADFQKQQLRAVIDGDSEFTRFDLLLHRAAQRKDLAKYALLAHVDGHGC